MKRRSRLPVVGAMLTGVLVASGAVGVPGAGAKSRPHGQSGCAPLESHVRAYGYVPARAGTRPSPARFCGKNVEIKQIWHATLVAPSPGSQAGTFCLALRHPNVSSVEPVAVVGAAGVPPTGGGLPYVTSIQGAPDCPTAQVEIRTFIYRAATGGGTLEPSEAVSFTFVVL